MSNEWQDTFPTESGYYWFYGSPKMGSMGRDFMDGYVPTAETTLVHITPNTVVSQGSFISRRKFDKNVRREGWLGYWKKTTLPEPPYDGNNYFNEK